MQRARKMLGGFLFRGECLATAGKQGEAVLGEMTFFVAFCYQERKVSYKNNSRWLEKCFKIVV
jgi:hypothetical protein